MDGIPPWDDEDVNPAAERGSSSQTQVGLPRPELEVPLPTGTALPAVMLLPCRPGHSREEKPEACA